MAVHWSLAYPLSFDSRGTVAFLAFQPCSSAPHGLVNQFRVGGAQVTRAGPRRALIACERQQGHSDGIVADRRRPKVTNSIERPMWVTKPVTWRGLAESGPRSPRPGSGAPDPARCPGAWGERGYQ
jgi:hypothetical protein